MGVKGMCVYRQHACSRGRYVCVCVVVFCGVCVACVCLYVHYGLTVHDPLSIKVLSKHWRGVTKTERGADTRAHTQRIP